MTAELITLPSSSCFAAVTITLQSSTTATESPFSFEEQNFFWGGQKWEIDFVMPPLKGRQLAADWISFGLKCKGTYNHFLIGDPTGKQPRGSVAGSPVIDGAGQKGNTLEVTGFTPNSQGVLLKGDYFQLGAGINARLFMITENINSDSSGNAVLEFVPFIQIPFSDGAAIITNNPVGLFRMMENSWTWGVRPGQWYSVGFRARSVV